MLRSLVFALTLLLSLAAALHTNATVPVNPDSLIADLGGKTLGLLQQKQLTQRQRETQFRTLLHEGFDMAAMSRFVLGPYWRTATDPQRQEFLKLFEDYIVTAYSARFSQYSGEQFKTTGSRSEGADGWLVSSQILHANGGPPTKVDWRVGKMGTDFKINDVVVEGISLAITQRQEFASVIQRNGGQLESLLKVLREKTRQ